MSTSCRSEELLTSLREPIGPTKRRKKTTKQLRGASRGASRLPGGGARSGPSAEAGASWRRRGPRPTPFRLETGARRRSMKLYALGDAISLPAPNGSEGLQRRNHRNSMFFEVFGWGPGWCGSALQQDGFPLACHKCNLPPPRCRGFG